MIASTIGRTFLKAYNAREGTDHDGKTFFEEVYIPLFFDHPKYMISGGNAPLDNPKIKKGTFPSADERQSRIAKTLDKIEQAVSYDASIAMGFPASDVLATTSGQVTNLELPVEQEDIYLSWIGNSLGVGIAGALAIYFNTPQILLDLFDGWLHYRGYLNNPAYNLRGNKVNTWNGQWLAHIYEKGFDEDDPLLGLDTKAFSTDKSGVTSVDTKPWVQIVLGIARFYPKEQLLGYVYSLGKMNETVGFIPFNLPKIRRPTDLYKKLFGEADISKAEALYGTARGFRSACQMGSVGIEALEPKGLGKLIPKGKKDSKTTMPKYDTSEDQIVSFRTYQTWLLAMLNNDELWEVAGTAAQAFLDYEKGAGKAKTDRRNHVKQLLESANKRTFISELTELLKNAEELGPLSQLGKKVHFMPADNFRYFVTLIRFRYAELYKAS